MNDLTNTELESIEESADGWTDEERGQSSVLRLVAEVRRSRSLESSHEERSTELKTREIDLICRSVMPTESWSCLGLRLSSSHVEDTFSGHIALHASDLAILRCLLGDLKVAFNQTLSRSVCDALAKVLSSFRLDKKPT